MPCHRRLPARALEAHRVLNGQSNLTMEEGTDQPTTHGSQGEIYDQLALVLITVSYWTLYL